MPKKELNNNDLKITKSDKDKITKEIKDEAKESLVEELLLVIDRETKNKLDKMEKKIYHYKKVAICKRNIVIFLLLLIIFLETKVLYDNNILPYLNTNNSNSSSLTTTSKSNSQEEEKDLNWYLKHYSYLIDNIKTNLSTTDYLYLYQDNYNVLTIREDIKLNMAYQLLDSNAISKDNSVITLKEESLKESYQKIFGSLDTYTATNFNDDCISFIYNSKTSTYMAIDTTCPSNPNTIVKSITNIEETNTSLIFTLSVGIYNSTNHTLSKIDNTLVTENYDPNTLNSYQDSLSKYTYTFKKVDTNYYLDTIEKSS